jgi:hypothetical protein
MNEWCEEHLSKEQKEKVFKAAMLNGFNPDDYFDAIDDDFFDMSNVSSDGSMDPGIEASIDSVINKFKQPEVE